MNYSISKRRERLQHRRTLLNEIHFTYSNLAKLIRAMIPREANGRLGRLLKHQLAHDQQAQHAVVELGMDLGLPPGPCVCADSEAVLEVIHHADRADRTFAKRDVGIVEALREARVFIIRLWGSLLDGVEEEQGHGPMFERVFRLQGSEADQHRELVRTAAVLHDDEHGGRLKRTA